MNDRERDPFDESEDTRILSIPGETPAASAGRPSLVVIQGDNIGKSYPLENGTTYIGRAPRHKICLSMGSVSRSHARLYRIGDQVLIEDLNSTNGTFINDRKITKCSLGKNDKVRLGDVVLKFVQGSDVEANFHREMYQMATSDPLTGLPNRRFSDEVLSREMARCLRHARPLSLLMMDIDHFKAVNDKYGHVAGDFILRSLVETIIPNIRREDSMGRYGGEEFLIISPEITEHHASLFAEKLRAIVESATFHHDSQDIRITISLGVAQMPEHCESTQDFVRIVDRRLYAAKRGGRNRVVASD